MFLWFVGVSFAFVWWVFRSPALDFRLVMLGALLPLGEVVFGGPRLLHTLLAPVVVLVVVMLATRERRLLRRSLIGIPIGMLMHLVLDGIWTRAAVFWWPFLGWTFPPGQLPELGRSIEVIVLLELLGAAALAFMWRAFSLGERAHRDRFVRTGQLPRERGPQGPAPTC